MIFVEGQKFEQVFEIEERLHAGFIELFGDRNPMHTDRDFAAAHGFRDLVMHGNMLGGFLSFFIGACLPTENVMILSQTISYHNPFFIGDQLAFSAVVETVSESVGLVDFAFVFRNQDLKRVAKGSIQIKVFQ